jgi:hypothetical protein
MYFQTGQFFFSQNGQRGSLLVFYVGNILVDKNTLCNGCILNRFIGFIQCLQVIWTVFVSSHVTSHKFLEDVHEDSVQFPSQINQFWCNRPDAPQCLEALTLKMFGRQGNTVRTLGQASPISTQSWISVDTYLGGFCKTSRRRSNISLRYPAF